MRILVTGSRNWPDFDRIGQELSALLSSRSDWTPPATLISGACPTGADRMAEMWFERWGFEIERHPAQWKVHTDKCPDWHQGQSVCKMAGFRRNSEMVNASPDVCIAFIYQKSPGATATANEAEARGIPVIRIELD